MFGESNTIDVSGKLDHNISPFLPGVPLTALQKKSSGIRPIVVRKCCANWLVGFAVRLPDILLHRGQGRCWNTRRLRCKCPFFAVIH